MCRHLAYLGPAGAARQRSWSSPPHGLYRQSWAPRRQRYGTVNADGFGVGWYARGRPGAGPLPAGRARSGPTCPSPTSPGWSAPGRCSPPYGTPPMAGADGEAAAAPFAAGPWLFSHNGAVTGWPRLAGAARR